MREEEKVTMGSRGEQGGERLGEPGGEKEEEKEESI